MFAHHGAIALIKPRPMVRVPVVSKSIRELQAYFILFCISITSNTNHIIIDNFVIRITLLYIFQCFSIT